jgi:integrase/recombinase XerD
MTSTKSAEAISRLRRRMIEVMCVRKFRAKTQHDYIRYVETFAKFLARSPDTATGEALQNPFSTVSTRSKPGALI